MSFCGTVKSELCRDEIRRSCCALAELHGALLYANTFSADCIRVVTESRDFGERLVRLLYKAMSLRFDVLPESQTTGKLTYLLTDADKIRRVFELCGFSAETSVSLHVNLALLENDCCKRAFLRGAFLAGGSVTDPEKRYHLELSTTHLKVVRETDTLMQEMNLAPKQTERKGSGGALALAAANRVYMLENAVYSVVSPEGCASILWKDAGRAPDAAECLHITAEDMLQLQVAERIIPENFEDFSGMCAALAVELSMDLQELCRMTPAELLEQRYRRFRRIGVYEENGCVIRFTEV